MLMADVFSCIRLMNLDQSAALFREVGMDWWTERAEGLRGRIDVGEAFREFAPYVDGPLAVS